jgi:hypothetical protein
MVEIMGFIEHPAADGGDAGSSLERLYKLAGFASLAETSPRREHNRN